MKLCGFSIAIVFAAVGCGGSGGGGNGGSGGTGGGGGSGAALMLGFTPTNAYFKVGSMPACGDGSNNCVQSCSTIGNCNPCTCANDICGASIGWDGGILLADFAAGCNAMATATGLTAGQHLLALGYQAPHCIEGTPWEPPKTPILTPTGTPPSTGYWTAGEYVGCSPSDPTCVALLHLGYGGDVTVPHLDNASATVTFTAKIAENVDASGTPSGAMATISGTVTATACPF